MTVPHEFHLILKNRKITSIEHEGVQIKGFKSPLTENGLPKLYVVKHGSKIIYVGIASQSLSNRLRYGFQAKGKAGYHGYRWKDLSEVDLIVWCFPEKSLSYIEGIEAELVYLIRNCTGKWPEYQTEIHFHNTTDKETETAKKIFESLSANNHMLK